MVYETLREVPRLFQIWACKQMMGIAVMMEWDKSTIQMCPSCMVERDIYAHVPLCQHKGQVATLKLTLEIMEDWLSEAETDPDLLDCIMEYTHGRGGRMMESICSGLGPKFSRMAREQDSIGWRHFMEEMIRSSMRGIQYDFH